MDARSLKPEMTGSSPAGATVAIGQWQSGRLWICLRGFDSPWSHYGWVCLAARAADCKSVTQKHRRFESCPIHFRLRVRVVYGAILLRWCAATHRRFKSFRKRFESERIRLFNMTTFSSNIASYLLLHFHKNFFHFFIISNCFPFCNLVFDSFFMFQKLHSGYFR